MSRAPQSPPMQGQPMQRKPAPEPGNWTGMGTAKPGVKIGSTVEAAVDSTVDSALDSVSSWLGKFRR